MDSTRAVEWDDARALAHSLASPLGTVTVSISEAHARTLAVDLAACVDMPGADSAAMDGWAVAGDPPWAVVGDRPPADLRPGSASGISTGEPLPTGAHAVLRRERGVVTDDRLRPGPGVVLPAGADLRRRAEEFGVGDRLLRRGTRLGAWQLALAAAAGHDHVEVARRPVVDLIISGEELIDRGVPGRGMVRDVYSHTLPSIVEAAGGAVGELARVSDDLERLVARLASSRAEAVVVTGGTAVGRRDKLRAALSELDATLVVEEIAVKPGHPSLLAQLPDGRPIVGLPGNPLAAYVGAAALVEPLLDGFLGRGLAEYIPIFLGASLAPAKTARVVPVRLERGRGIPVPWSGSNMLRGLSSADVLVLVPSGAGAARDVARVVANPV